MADMEKNTMNEEHGSRIVSVKIQNFMSIKDALIEFDEDGIISLCGYNDSGKSAITRLFEVMFYNKYSTEQVRFITDGEDFWSCSMTFDDGVVYTREKYADGKGLYELKTKDKMLFTNRLQNDSFAAISDVPEVIATYLGVLKDEFTGQQVNVRRNTDPLFLIETTGGQNYKILNNILRSDVLASASQNLNEDKNKLASEVSEKETVRQVYEDQYTGYEVAPKEDIDEVKTFISSLETYGKRSNAVLSVIDILTQLNGISVYEELKPIDTNRLTSLQKVVGLSKEVKQPIYDAVSPIDTDRLKALRNIISARKGLNISTYDALSTVDVERAKEIRIIAELYNQYMGAEATYAKVVEKVESKKKELKELSEKHGLKICKNCGSFVD